MYSQGRWWMMADREIRDMMCVCVCVSVSVSVSVFVGECVSVLV